MLLTYSLNITQAQEFLYQHHGVANHNNLYVIWIGANDYLNNNVNRSSGAPATPELVTGAINQTMTNLYNGGARR